MIPIQEESTTLKPSSKWILFGKYLLSFGMVFIGFLTLSYLLVTVVPDFSTMQYSGWILLGGLIAIIAYLRRKYHVAWMPLLVPAFFIWLNIGTIEQYSPDRLMFHYRMDQWKKSGNVDVYFKDLVQSIVPTGWNFSVVYNASLTSGMTHLISCRETPYLCHTNGEFIYLPWGGDKNYVTVVLEKNHHHHFIRVPVTKYLMFKW